MERKGGGTKCRAAADQDFQPQKSATACRSDFGLKVTNLRSRAPGLHIVVNMGLDSIDESKVAQCGRGRVRRLV